jgi:hypothetical protein
MITVQVLAVNMTFNVNLIHFKMEELSRKEDLAMMPLSGAKQNDIEQIYYFQANVSHLH